MDSQGYVYILNAKYAFFRSALDFYLIPANEDDKVNYAHLSNSHKTLIPYKESVYSNSHILVDEIYPGEGTSLKLKAKCIFARINDSPISRFDLVGNDIDSMFSPAHYYFVKKQRGDYSSSDLLYSCDEIESYDFSVDSKKIKVTLCYGNILTYGLLSDTKLHPTLRIEFDPTNDLSFIYRVFLIITSFIQQITRCKCIRFQKIDLVSYIDNSYQSVGYMFDASCLNKKNEGWLSQSSFLEYSAYISSILQMIADDGDVLSEHLADFNYNILNYSSQRFQAIFAAFEREYKKSSDKYSQLVDNENVNQIKEELVNYLKQFSVTDDEVKHFLDNARERIQQLGTQEGQTRKIINAYNYLEDCFKNSYIFYSHSNPKISDIARKTAALRGEITHYEPGKELNFFEKELVQFMDILQMAMFLDRANIPHSDIEKILGPIFHCNYLYLDEKNNLKI